LGILELFERYLESTLSHEPSSEITEEDINKKAENIRNVILKLKNVSSKEHIVKECVYLFYDADFLEKLDRSAQIICFSNGVLDLRTNEFRPGNPDDMVSLHIDMDFVTPKNQKEQIEITKIIEMFQKFRLSMVNKRRNRQIFFPA